VRRRGRPPGTGQLGADQVRVTVRIPQALYLRLALRAYHRDSAAPEVAACVREAIEAYLTQPIPGSHKKRIPGSHKYKIPGSHEHDNP
jgi:hypothetical protein